MASKLNHIGEARWTELAVLVGPAMTLFAVFVFVPFVMAVGFSFSNIKLLQNEQIEWVGFDNYTRLFSIKIVATSPSTFSEKGDRPSSTWRQLKRDLPAAFEGYQFMMSFTALDKQYLVGARDPQFLRSIFNTFLFAAQVVPIQTLLALVMALWVNRQFSGRFVLRTVFFAPVVTSMVVVSAIWGLILHTDSGLLNQVILAIFGADATQPDWLGDSSTAMLSIAVMSAWQGAGFQMLIFLSGLQGISREQYEAAEVMGASQWQQFLYITFPSLHRTILFVTLATTIAALGLFTQVDVLTGGGPKDSTTTLIFHAVRVGFREQDIAYASAVSLFFFLLVLLIALLQRKILERNSV